MSIEVNTNRNTGVRQISIKRPDGSKVGTITIHSSSLKKLKKLSYKQRRISTMITQAKTSTNAKQVVASAKTETVNLRRKLASGKYNDREVRAAIRHAERMERIAKKRMKHLMQEEAIEKNGGGTWQPGFDEEDAQEYGQEMEGIDIAELSAEEMEELMQELQQEMEELAMENEMEMMQSVRLDMDKISNITKIVGQVKYENAVSARTFEKCGFLRKNLPEYIQYEKSVKGVIE